MKDNEVKDKGGERRGNVGDQEDETGQRKAKRSMDQTKRSQKTDDKIMGIMNKNIKEDICKEQLQ